MNIREGKFNKGGRNIMPATGRPEKNPSAMGFSFTNLEHNTRKFAEWIIKLEDRIEILEEKLLKENKEK